MHIYIAASVRLSENLCRVPRTRRGAEEAVVVGGQWGKLTSVSEDV